MSNDCACGATPKLIFACSGAADVGAIADRAVRRLTQEGTGKMYCLAGVGGRVSGIMKTTESASMILVVDGCPLDCAKNCLEKAGFRKYEHFRVTDMGLETGKSPVTAEAVEKVAARGRELLSKEAGA